MVSAQLISPGSAVRALVATIVLLVVGIVISGFMPGLAFLGLALWTIMLAGLATGGFLIVRGGRTLAGAGVLVLVASIGLAFYVNVTLPPFIWVGMFFVGVGLIAWGTRDDAPLKSSWPVALPRIVVGWAFVDNANDHFINNWLPSVQGTGFFQAATSAANRAPAQWVDALYRPFLQNVVAANPDQWAALTMVGELSFGLLLAAGFLTPVGAIGAMWHSGNYMLMKSFTAHGNYFDKTFFVVELFSLLVLAGLAYGLDASMRRLVPAAVAKWLMGGTPAKTAEAATALDRMAQPA